jgi:hypothetical protein
MFEIDSRMDGREDGHTERGGRENGKGRRQHTGGQVLKGERRDKKEPERARERNPHAIANPTHKTYNQHKHTHTPTTNEDWWPGQPTSWKNWTDR